MTVSAGTRLGPYEIVAPIGVGGMGEVFTARDTRLQRIVAIKILPEAVAGDEVRRSRLQREAKIISQLNHPHICTLHDTGSQDGIDFLVMEHLDGHSLADRLTKGPLPLDEVVRIGIETAQGLHRAHQQNIVHRDLKPGNIMLTSSGVKLLDFGLAKFVDSKDATLTVEGAIVGTPRYMAPEQIEGRPSDHRADIFAFGCVLYEMRTGNPALGGVERVRPAALDHVIAKCLERNPAQRWQSAWDIAEQLRWIGDATSARIGRRPRWKLSALMAATVALLALLAWFAPRLFRREERRPPRATFNRLTDAAGIEEAPTISPDGKFFAYQSDGGGKADIYLQRIGGQNTVNLTADSDTHNAMPSFSPDGQRIAFRSERERGGIFVMGATGESVRRVSDFGYNPAWSPDGKDLAVSSQAIFGSPYATGSPSTAIWSIEVATGRKRRLFEGDAVSPTWSPRGSRIAFCLALKGDIVSIPSTGGQATPITSGPSRDWNPIWSTDGHIYFSSNRAGSMNLWRIAVDEATGTPRGEPEPLTTPALWSGSLGITGDGRKIIYCARDRQAILQHVSFDPVRERVVGPLAEVPLGKMVIAFPDVSPDGEWITFSTLYQQEDVYVVRKDGSGLRKLTDDPFTDTWTRWSPDGRRIAFASNRPGLNPTRTRNFEIWAINADGSGLQQLTDLEHAGGPVAWSPDGHGLIIRSKACKGVCFVDVSGSLPATTAEPLRRLQEGFQSPMHAWSPDGKWVLGTAWAINKETEAQGFLYSIDSGEYRLLPEGMPHSITGSSRWMSDGRRILLLRGNKLIVVDRRTLNPREIHSFALTPFEFMLTKDDRTIYVLRMTDEADIWVAELQ